MYLFLCFGYLNGEKPIDSKTDHRGLKDWKIGQVVAKLQIYSSLWRPDWNHNDKGFLLSMPAMVLWDIKYLSLCLFLCAELLAAYSWGWFLSTCQQWRYFVLKCTITKDDTCSSKWWNQETPAVSTQFHLKIISLNLKPKWNWNKCLNQTLSKLIVTPYVKSKSKGKVVWQVVAVCCFY